MMSQTRVGGSGRHPAVQLSRVRSRSRSRLSGDSECLGVEGRMSNECICLAGSSSNAMGEAGSPGRRRHHKGPRGRTLAEVAKIVGEICQGGNLASICFCLRFRPPHVHQITQHPVSMAFWAFWSGGRQRRLRNHASTRPMGCPRAIVVACIREQGCRAWRRGQCKPRIDRRM